MADTVRVRFELPLHGLWLNGAPDRMPEGTARRLRNVSGRLGRTIQTRLGSTLISNHDNINSLFHWVQAWYGVASDGSFVRLSTGTDVNVLDPGELSGDRSVFAPMQVPAGVPYLFVAGSAQGSPVYLFKMDVGETVSRWGIAPPDTDFNAAAGAAGTLNGTYRYRVTFSSLTDSESNPNENDVIVTVTNQQVDLTNIPVSTDQQVTERRIYRTTGNGAAYFLAATIADNTTTVFTDNLPDGLLEPTALKFDNIDPSGCDFDLRQCAGPHHGRMWWSDDRRLGHGGRVYYSPAGRPEAIQGFIDVTSHDDPTHRIILWNGALWCFTKDKLFEIVGTDEPFTARQVHGAAGTKFPWSVVPSPYGILYRARDGELRRFNGVTSTLLGMEALGHFFVDGFTIEGMRGGDNWAYAVFARDEYIIGGPSPETSMALFLAAQPPRWRRIDGPKIQAAALNVDGVLAVSDLTQVLDFESSAVLQDNGVALDFEVEVPAILTDIGEDGVVQRIYIDAQTSGQTLTPSLVFKDGSTTALAPFSSLVRQVFEYEVANPGRVVAVRLEGMVTNTIEIFDMGADIYLPTGTRIQNRKWMGS